MTIALHYDTNNRFRLKGLGLGTKTAWLRLGNDSGREQTIFDCQ